MKTRNFVLCFNYTSLQQYKYSLFSNKKDTDFSTAMNGCRLGTPNPFLTCVTGLFNDNSQEERKFWAKTCPHRKISVIENLNVQ